MNFFLSGRHVGIRHFLKTCYSEITYEYDLGHLSKSLMKKFKTINKKYEDILVVKKRADIHY